MSQLTISAKIASGLLLISHESPCVRYSCSAGTLWPDLTINLLNLDITFFFLYMKTFSHVAA